MTNYELLAILLGTGTKDENVVEVSKRITLKYNLKELSSLGVSRLSKEAGIGSVKASQLVSCFELSRRLSLFHAEKKSIISSSDDIASVLIPRMSILEKETFIAVYLNTRRQIIKQETIFIGTLNESVVHAREIFKKAIEVGAAAIIVAHNHPSGDPTPSDADISVTKELIQSGEIIGISIIDHIIIGDNSYWSLKENNVI
jgi:DNA repair protein RadC